MKYIHRAHPSKIATISITFGAGSRVEHNSKYPEGIAHCLEHMVFKGSDKYTSKDMSKQIALQGGSWNAFTSNDMVQYHVEMPEENIEKGIELLSEVAFKHTFPEDEIGKEVEVICQEIRSYEDDMGSIARKNLYSRVFDNSLSKYVIGSEKSVRSITKKDLLAFSKEFYFPAGALIVESSNTSHAHLIEKYFGITDDVLALPPPAKEVKYAPSFHYEFVKEGFKQHNIKVAFGSEKIRDLKNTHLASTDVFNYIFGGGADARLFMSIREDLGLVYGVYSHMSNNFDGALFGIGTSTEPENSKKVLEAIDQVIQDFLNNPPSDDEMTKAKNMIRSGYYSQIDSSSGSASIVVSEEILGYPSTSNYLAQIDGVSKEDVMEVAKIIFAGNKYTVIGKGE